MASPTVHENVANVVRDWAGDVCSVARQPILTMSGRLHGYELLLRSGTANAACPNENAIDNLLDDTVVFGLERYTNGFPAFVCCTAEALMGQLVRVLPPALTVLTIAESIPPTMELADACRNLKARGFRLAIDDFTARPHPLLEMADYVRVDYGVPEPIGRTKLQFVPNSGRIAMVAKRLDTQEEYARARKEGFTLFQGDFFFRPALVKNRKVPANRLFHFEILQSLYREPVDLKKLSLQVMRDASLTYRLLRLVNSPVCAIRQEVHSIEAAIIIVGVDMFRRFATMAVLSELNTDQYPEVLHLALLRGRFCELGARMCRQNPAEQYLLGLFSLLPAMLRLPIEEAIEALPLRHEIRQALCGIDNHERCLLSWLERHERGNWQACDQIAETNRLSPPQLTRFYGEAALWAQQALQSASAQG